MTDKELKKLNRSELLEILLDQAQEIELLNEQINILKAKQQTREIKIQEAGNLAEAALQLTNVFQEAQKSADLYLVNSERISKEKTEAADLYEKEHKAKADEILEKSKADSKKMLYEIIYYIRRCSE